MKKHLVRLAAALLALTLLSVLIPPLLPADETLPPTPVKLAPARCQVAVLDDNQQALDWRLRLIDQARDSVDMAVYNLTDDLAGSYLMAALAQAGSRGVEVRLVVDGLCGLSLRRSSNFRALAAAPHVQVRIYNPLSLLRPWQGNYRMHDKFLISDDAAWIVGGRNANDRSLSPTGDLDRDLLVVRQQEDPGEVLTQFRDYFGEIWQQPRCKPVSGKPGHLPRLLSLAESLPQRRPAAYDGLLCPESAIPVERMALLRGPAQPKKKAGALWSSLVQAMDGQNVYLETPYVICSKAMRQDLQALTGNGGQLRLLTNAPEGGANPFGSADLLLRKGQLLDAGLEIGQWLGGNSLHGKTVLVGESLSFVGSCNLDMRSIHLNTELMLAVESPALNAVLRETGEQRLLQSRLLDGGNLTCGPLCDPGLRLSPLHSLFLHALGLLIQPVRYLL